MRTLSIFSILYFLFSVLSMAQSSSTFYGGAGVSHLSTGDMGAHFMGIGFQKKLINRLNVTVDVQMERGSNRDRALYGIDTDDLIHTVVLNSEYYNDRTWPDWLFGPVEGVAILPEKTAQTQIDMFKLGLNYAVIDNGPHQFLLGVKAGLAQIQFQYYRNSELGFFDGFTIPAQEVRLLVPVYGRFLDVSVAPHIQYGYWFNDRVSLNIQLTPDFFLGSGDRSYKAGLNLGVAL